MQSSKPVILNNYMRAAIRNYRLSESDFINRDWFQTYSHLLAIGYLLLLQQKSVEEAFKILEGLNSFQADGIRKGLERAEVLGCSESLIQKKVSILQSLDKALFPRYREQSPTPSAHPQPSKNTPG